MATIRQLTVQLGVEVDLTEIKRLDSALKQLKSRVSKVDDVGFKNLKQGAESLRGSFKGLIATVGLVGGAIAAAFKSFTAFTDEEQALTRLEFLLSKIPGNFEKTQSAIEKTIQGTGGLATRIELLNAAAASFEIDTNPEAFNRSIEQATKLASILGDDVVDVSQAFAQFRAAGATEGLKKFGIFTAQELEVLQKAGTEVTEVGIGQRTKLLDRLLAKNDQTINDAFENFTETNKASFQKVGVAATETLTAIGESSTFLKSAADDTAESLRLFSEGLRDGKSFLDIFGELSDLETQRRGDGASDSGGFKIPGSGIVDEIVESKGVFKFLFDKISGGSSQQNTQVSNNITVNTAATNGEETARAVNREMQKMFGQTSQQARRNTIRRGQNQVVE